MACNLGVSVQSARLSGKLIGVLAKEDLARALPTILAGSVRGVDVRAASDGRLNAYVPGYGTVLTVYPSGEFDYTRLADSWPTLRVMTAGLETAARFKLALLLQQAMKSVTGVAASVGEVAVRNGAKTQDVLRVSVEF